MSGSHSFMQRKKSASVQAHDSRKTTNVTEQPLNSSAMHSPVQAAMHLQKLVGNRSAMKMLAPSNKSYPNSRPSGGPLQLKPAVMGSFSGAHMRDYTEEQDPQTSQTTYKVHESQPKGPKIKFRNEFENLELTDETNQWTMVEFKGETGFIRTSKIKEKGGLSKARNLLEEQRRRAGTPISQINGAQDEEDADLLETAVEVAGEGFDLGNTIPGGIAESYGKKADQLDDDNPLKDKLESDQAALEIGTAHIDATLSGLSGIVAMKKIIDTVKDDEMSKTEKGFDITENALETAEAATNTVGSTAGYYDNLGTLTDTDKLSAAGDVSDWSGTVGEAIGVIKSAFFTVKDIYDMFQKATGQEGIGLDETVTSTLDIIKGALQTAQGIIKTVKSIYDILQTGTSALGQAIPGIGIAISGIVITLKVYGMIKSEISRRKMKQDKKKFITEYANKNKEYVTPHGVDLPKLQQRKAEIKAKADNARTEEEKKELQDIEQYLLAEELRYINQKRLTRNGLQVGLEMVSIAGDIATLSGVGAQAGVPLKTAVAGTKVSMSVARRLKQYGRDRAAKSGAWTITKKIFNAEKSTEKKNARRLHDANLILDMIANLPPYKAGDEGIKAQYQRVEDFISATGINPKELYRLNGNIEKQRELLMNGMKKREY